MSDILINVLILVCTSSATFTFGWMGERKFGKGKSTNKKTCQDVLGRWVKCRRCGLVRMIQDHETTKCPECGSD